MSKDKAPPPPPARRPPAERRVGFIGLAGAPNIGKSTLVNHLVGQKISIVSDRPQTTRERICGIYTDDRMQAVLVDIPGIMGADQARDPFNRAMLDTVARSLGDCDLILHLRDARHPEDERDRPVRELLRLSRKPLWLIWNKIDRVAGRLWSATPPDNEGPPLAYERTLGISGKTGRGVPKLLEALAETLPIGPLLYDPDQLSDRDLRHLAAELVREKLFRYLGQELPYQLTTMTERFDETSGEKAIIGVTILTERAAHKPIIIGDGGKMLKKIGQSARLELEKMLERPVYLELWVKVRPKWRQDEQLLLELGLKSSDSS
jgi:GTP-binding protein Era